MRRGRDGIDGDAHRVLWRALRASFNDAEWSLLQARLTHAVKAVDTLRARVPTITRQIYQALENGRRSNQTGVHLDLTSEGRGWIDGLICSLLQAENELGLSPDAASPIQHAVALRLVPPSR